MIHRVSEDKGYIICQGIGIFQYVNKLGTYNVPGDNKNLQYVTGLEISK